MELERVEEAEPGACYVCNTVVNIHTYIYKYIYAPSANAASRAIWEIQSWFASKKRDLGPATSAQRCANYNIYMFR